MECTASLGVLLSGNVTILSSLPALLRDVMFDCSPHVSLRAQGVERHGTGVDAATLNAVVELVETRDAEDVRHRMQRYRIENKLLQPRPVVPTGTDPLQSESEFSGTPLADICIHVPKVKSSKSSNHRRKSADAKAALCNRACPVDSECALTQGHWHFPGSGKATCNRAAARKMVRTALKKS